MNLKATNVFERNWNADTRFIVNQGGSRCFAPDTLVVSKNGKKKISEVKEGDEVLSFNEETKQKEWRQVKNLFRLKNDKPTIRIKLKNGSEIIATEDHRFWHQGGWVSLKTMLKLKNKNNSK